MDKLTYPQLKTTFQEKIPFEKLFGVLHIHQPKKNNSFCLKLDIVKCS